MLPAAIRSMNQTDFYRALEAAQRALAGAGPAPGTRAGVASAVLDALAAASPERPRHACRPGCDHCCRHPVGVTFAEAVDLRQAVAALPPDRRRRLADAVALAATATATVAWRDLSRLPCPLLDGGLCAVHAQRPLPCRAWASTDRQACADSLTRGAAVPFDRHAFAAGLGVAAALAAAAPAGHRELRSALARLLAARGKPPCRGMKLRQRSPAPPDGR
jgi:hypothetical protein